MQMAINTPSHLVMNFTRPSSRPVARIHSELFSEKLY